VITPGFISVPSLSARAALPHATVPGRSSAEEWSAEEWSARTDAGAVVAGGSSGGLEHPGIMIAMITAHNGKTDSDRGIDTAYGRR
jgi:hypothetical protein